MPELPEVETTKRGLQSLIVNQVVAHVYLYRSNLRWEIPEHLPDTLRQQKIHAIERRGKYLLIKFKVGVLIIHLGMSGTIKVVNANTCLQKHDHFEMGFGNKTLMRLNDPRRFGAVLFAKDGSHPLLNNLGVEPLTSDFNADYLYHKSGKKSIKALIMDSKIVVGIGNIYACESLFMAGINPQRQAGKLAKKRHQLLTEAIKQILVEAIKIGGTTLQDFSQVDGTPGYFSQCLKVYGRENQECTACGGKIVRILQNQRATFYCPKCQT